MCLCTYRQLHKDAVDIWVLIELLDRGKHLGLRGRGRQARAKRSDANLLAGLLLHAHIRLAVLPLPHNDNSQAWHLLESREMERAICLILD